MLNDHKARIAQNFGKAAAIYTQHNRLQQICAQHLMQRLPQQLGVVLDAGCGPAVNTHALSARAQHYVGFDLSAGMLAHAQTFARKNSWVQGDIEQLPFAANSFDQIYINLALQWAGDLAATLRQLIYCLKPNGKLVFSTVLDGSMAPLGALFKRHTGHCHHNQFLTMRALEHILVTLQQGNHAAAQLSTRVVNKHIAIPYIGLTEMLRDLKGIGANYQPAGVKRLTRNQLRQVEKSLENHRLNDGMLYLTWSIGFVEITFANCDKVN